MHRDLAEVVADTWKRELNVNAKLLNQEWKVYLDTQNTINYDVSALGVDRRLSGCRTPSSTCSSPMVRTTARVGAIRATTQLVRPRPRDEPDVERNGSRCWRRPRPSCMDRAPDPAPLRLRLAEPGEPAPGRLLSETFMDEHFPKFLVLDGRRRASRTAKPADQSAADWTLVGAPGPSGRACIRATMFSGKELQRPRLF